MKEENERRMREENELRLRQEINDREASLLAEEARLRDMREMDILRREMESGVKQNVSDERVEKTRESRKRKLMEPNEFDDLVIRTYSNFQFSEPNLPKVPLVKIREGVYRFGTRNLFLEPSDLESAGVIVRQGANTQPFDGFVAKYQKTEAMKLKGMACLGGFMGAGYV